MHLEIQLDGRDLKIHEQLKTYCSMKGFPFPSGVVEPTVIGIAREAGRIKKLIDRVAADPQLPAHEKAEYVNSLAARSLAVKRLRRL